MVLPPPEYEYEDRASQITIIYTIEGAHRTDIAKGCLGRLLHHIPKLPSQQKLSPPRHYIYLDLQGISSYAGPGQSTYDSYLILFIGILKGYLLFSQVFSRLLSVILMVRFSSSRNFLAAFLHTSPILRSRLRTPASLV